MEKPGYLAPEHALTALRPGSMLREIANRMTETSGTAPGLCRQRRGMSTRREVLALASGAALATASPAAAAPAGGSPGAGGWTGTWAAVPTTIPPGPPTVLQDQTVRHVVHV